MVTTDGQGRRSGQDVVRRVVEVETQLARLRGERGQFAEGVAAGALRHQPDPVARGEQLLVAGAMEEDPLDRALETDEAVHKVAHVRADAVVGRLADVDADPHGNHRARRNVAAPRSRLSARRLAVDLEHPTGGAVPGETGGAGEAPVAHCGAAAPGRR